jgi:RimJ/RimL family protein N-acetyltransferase
MTSDPKRTQDCASASKSTPPGPTPGSAVNPLNFAATHILRNGTTILIRAVRPDDKARLRSTFGKLEKTTVYMRFFGYKDKLTDVELEQATNVDFDQVVALWATTGPSDAETIIAGARYVRDPNPNSRHAEVAFTVEEDYHGQGIAGRLLAHLIDIARGKGLLRFEADVLANNRPMLAVFARSGLPMQRQSSEGVVHVTLRLDAKAS